MSDMGLDENYYNIMRAWFYKRLRIHIEYVQKYCRKIEEYDAIRFEGLIKRGLIHDQNKYEDPEIEPYIFITWKYKCKENGFDFVLSEDMQAKAVMATEHHVNNNSHHPEFHCSRCNNIINRANRDEPPDEIIDATGMPVFDIAEMVADWMAVSEEKGNCPIDWADRNVNKRWKFDADQVRLIYELINVIWLGKNNYMEE
jgi:hypothetical protein